MKKIILILFIFCCTKFTLTAQEITSTLTLLTTDLLQGEARSNFNWRTIQLHPFKPFSTNTLARGGFGESEDCGPVGVFRWQKMTIDGPEGYGDYWVWGVCLETGWHSSSIMVKSSELVDALFGQSQGGGGGPTPNPNDPYGPLFGDHPSDWYPPNPSLPTDQGGGGTLNPNDPHGSPPKDPDKDPAKPVKPSKGLDDDPARDSFQIQIKKDTLQPTIDSACSDSAIQRAKLADSLFQKAATSASYQQLSDSLSLNCHNEVCFSLGYKDSTNNFQVSPLLNGTPRNSPIVTSDSLIRILATFHTHPDSSDVSPSVADIYKLLEDNRENRDYTIGYNINNVTGYAMAIIIEDTTKARAFLNNFPRTTYFDPITNSWSNSSYQGYSMDKIFKYAVNDIAKFNYPLEWQRTYANMLILSRFDSGIKFLKQNQDGHFKEIKIELISNILGEAIYCEVFICE